MQHFAEAVEAGRLAVVRLLPLRPTHTPELTFTHQGGIFLVTPDTLEAPTLTESLLLSLIPNVPLEPDGLRGIFVTGPLIRTWVRRYPKSLAEIIRMPDHTLKVSTERLGEPGLRCFRTATRVVSEHSING